MEKLKKILFPTDFSAPATEAFLYTLALADKLNAQIEILHVLFPQAEALEYPGLTSHNDQEEIESALISLKFFIETGINQIKDKLSKPPNFQKELEVGMPIHTICKIAKRDDVDLIVMGSKGENRSKLAKMLGTVAAGVVKNSSVPVIVIPEDTVFKGITSIAYATDLSEADPFEIWKSVRVLSPFNPVIHTIHIDTEEEVGSIKPWEWLEELQAFFSENHPGIQLEFHRLRSNNLMEGLNNFIDQNEIDLLIMYQPQRRFWDRLFHRSMTKKMAVYTHVPLFVQKEKKVS